MKSILLISMAMALGSVLRGQEPVVETPPKPAGEQALEPHINAGVLPAQYQGRPLLWIPRLAEPDKLAGDLSAEVWKKAAAVNFSDCISAKEMKLKTEGFVFCSDDALYFGFRCQEPRPDDLKTDGAEIWENDEVEIFIEPNKDTLQRPYHQIIVDASGKKEVHRIHIYPRHQESRITEPWDPSYETATSKGVAEWSCEIRLPFKELKLTGAAREKKTLWRLNLYRHRPRREEEPETDAAWSPTLAPVFHAAGKFGYALPAVFSTPDLIKEVCRTAHSDVPIEPPKLVNPAVTAEIKKRIDELGAENYGERKLANERLQSIAATDPLCATELKKELLEAALRSRETQVVASAKRILGSLKPELFEYRDEDPPPRRPAAR